MDGLRSRYFQHVRTAPRTACSPCSPSAPLLQTPTDPSQRNHTHTHTHIHLLQRINKIRPRIPQKLHLLERLPLGPIIPPPAPALRVLPPQQEILQNTAAEQEEGEVSEDDAVARAVEGRVRGAVDVGGDDAVEVAPAYDDAHGDAALVDAFGVVGAPDDGVGDAGVDAEGGEEGACVLDAGVGAGILVVSLLEGKKGGGLERGGCLRGRGLNYPATSMEKPMMPRKEQAMLQRPR